MNDIKEIVDQLKIYDDAYHNGEELVSDAEYENLRKVLRNLDPTNAYFDIIGADVRGGKVDLPHSMPSLDQKFDEELLPWFQKRNLWGKDLVVTDKLDGSSLMIEYRDGELLRAYSRGNSLQGADVTRHIRNNPSVPKKLSGNPPSYLCVRAESIIKNSVFESKYKSEYKTARAMVSGCMNASVTAQNKLNDINVIAYEVKCGRDYSTKEAMIKDLGDFGFDVVANESISLTHIDDVVKVLKTILIDAKAQSDYELDGIVVTINDLTSVEKLSSSSSLNPEDSIKFKLLSEDDIVETTVIKVIWELSKSGWWKPRVQIAPVELFGTTVTYASGYNGKFIRDNGIGPGAKVRITKAGSVIPQILECVKQTAPQFPDGTDWGWNDNDVEIVAKNFDENPDVKFKQILDFFNTVEVELFKEATLKTIFEKYDLGIETYETILEHIFNMLEIEWVKLIGANGSKIFASLHRRLQNMTLETYFGAIKYFGVGFGVRKSRKIISQLGEVAVWKATIDQVTECEGFDTKTATQFVSGLGKASIMLNKWNNEGLINIVQKAAPAGTEFSKLNVVFTEFRDKTLETKIEAGGGKIASSVSAKVTHVITPDVNSTSGKATKARSLGIRIITPEDFKDEFKL